MPAVQSAATTRSKDVTVADGHPLPGLVRAFRFGADGSAEELAVDQPIAEDEGWLWLHFNLADGRACQFLKSLQGLPAPASELLIAADEHQQLHADETCVYGVLADLVCGLDGATEEIGFLHFAMTERLFVSSRRHSLNAVEATRRALRGGLKVATVAGLLEVIMEQVVEAVDRYAEDLAGHLDRIEEKILAGELSIDRQMIGRVRRMTVRLHRQLAILRSLIYRFERNMEPSWRTELRLATEKLRQRLDWLDNEIVALRDRSHLLQEEITLKTAEQTNRNLQVLSIVTTVFLPATLVAGIFGMNVEGLPLTYHESGFLWAMAILIAASALVYWLLRRSVIRRQ
jgi:zinc transporter